MPNIESMPSPVALDAAPEVNVVPPSAEVLEAMVAAPDQAPAMGKTAIEEIMRTDPEAAFEWPEGMTGNRGVTYTVPSGDA